MARFAAAAQVSRTSAGRRVHAPPLLLPLAAAAAAWANAELPATSAVAALCGGVRQVIAAVCAAAAALLSALAGAWLAAPKAAAEQRRGKGAQRYLLLALLALALAATPCLAVRVQATRADDLQHSPTPPPPAAARRALEVPLQSPQAPPADLPAQHASARNLADAAPPSSPPASTPAASTCSSVMAAIDAEPHLSLLALAIRAAGEPP